MNLQAEVATEVSLQNSKAVSSIGEVSGEERELRACNMGKSQAGLTHFPLNSGLQSSCEWAPSLRLAIILCSS